ncbi:cytochrome b N-terminal domain-containing protein [Gloeocapsopsis dulcis]|uniref:Cytochrome B6 n=1 Tax=Gloeocapsopsis dulcis AAB1 = 1H9 TaxID=1433147 RepID=A0A6N8FXE7_9CHRO|nr:cytochrome b N-terminal domain-containing protein [Gloeocapsopsis dulcis]MUL37743.1 cytochrome B6 [Gloeocapsopsis dulcis AAB1 = 1H9]WNN90638.1 cytochrome b N-terminal domain-containing protein [Gloeocapsopsis dulcis]
MKNLSYEFVLRRLATILSVAIISLSVMAAVTGVLLSFYYEPVAGRAYQSLNWIDTEIINGLLIHSIHDLAGNALIVTALIQIVVMFLGREFRLSWLTAWVSGILLALTGIGLSWTAIILDWSQVGYWRFRIELSTIEAIPVIGGSLRNILTGGGAVNTTTVAHLYTIHSYLLSVGAIALAIIHLWGLLQQEKEMKGNAIKAAAKAEQLQQSFSQTLS